MIAKSGRKDARRRFGWERVLGETNRVYRAAVERRSGA
jgi:hypothetical protein